MSQNMNLGQMAFEVMKFFVPFLFALCFHEFAHGWVARRKGDRTAETMGRLTLNPMAHADPIGTVVLPIMSKLSALAGSPVALFGWAKPVPVDERNLKNPKVDMFWIAAAGPISNLLLALVAAVAYGFFLKFGDVSFSDKNSGGMQIVEVISMFISINVFLAVFNMIPLHPLDGGKVLARFLPDSVNRQLEEWQMYTSILLLVLFVGGFMTVIAGPAMAVQKAFMELSIWIYQVL